MTVDDPSEAKPIRSPDKIADAILAFTLEGDEMTFRDRLEKFRKNAAVPIIPADSDELKGAKRFYKYYEPLESRMLYALEALSVGNTEYDKEVIERARDVIEAMTVVWDLDAERASSEGNWAQIISSQSYLRSEYLQELVAEVQSEALPHKKQLLLLFNELTASLRINLRPLSFDMRDVTFKS